MAPLTLVFDLDGTLVDTASDLIAATNHVLAMAGLPPASPQWLRERVSFGARRMIEAGLAAHGARRAPAELEHMLSSFLAHYEENIAVSSRPFPGVVPVLEAARRRGDKLAVCTNKSEALAVQLLDALGLSRLFGAITGGDTYPVCKPHPDHVLGAIRAAGGDPARAVMVGDSATDVRAARAAGIPVIGVTFGYTDVPVASLGVDATIEAYADFSTALAQVQWLLSRGEMPT
jgi:phosphoglycolate phosphatase